ncbi:hypothetical protein KC19_4G136400 [Ceratodon purpureus]|uniref:Uncharacterized protein n=1 Tax=Ceratodon purpureus TaxID=3225 RepID=A0A8T0I8D4_CERPU|nr:hypothetical protein KC19_4G136400 [Ceratodon purpureus]
MIDVIDQLMHFSDSVMLHLGVCCLVSKSGNVRFRVRNRDLIAMLYLDYRHPSFGQTKLLCRAKCIHHFFDG